MRIPKFLKKKRNIWIFAILIILIIIGFVMFGGKKNGGTFQTGFVEKQNLKQTVLSTGQVVSQTDLALSFQGSGVVRRVAVKEGDKVYKGQTLASLDQASALATLTSAQGSLAQAEASYQKLVNGATENEIKTQQDAVASAKVNLSNAYNSAFTTLSGAYSSIYNAYATVNDLYNNYFTASDQEGIKVQESRNKINDDLAKAKLAVDQAVNAQSTDLAVASMLNYLSSTFNALKTIREQCDQGVYYSRVLAADKTSVDTQKTAVNASISSVSTYQNSINSYKVALQAAENNLTVRKATPRQEDIDLAKAQVLSAQGQVDAAKAVLSNTIIFAPSDGTITQVNVRVGEQAGPSVEAIVLQDVGDLHAEANVSEASIAGLQVGQSIDYTFDALGPDKHFEGKVLTINPASIVISGVVNYKVTGSLENIPNIKPGMTANMTILVAEKSDSLAVPSTAIINKDNKQYVRVVDNLKNKTYHEVLVQTGLQADGGLVEIISGVNAGQQIVTYMKR